MSWETPKRVAQSKNQSAHRCFMSNEKTVVMTTKGAIALGVDPKLWVPYRSREGLSLCAKVGSR
eukprot:7988055-Pyramimonas_sp.AAC.2